MNKDNEFNLYAKSYIELKHLQTLVDDIEHFSTNMNRDFALINATEQNNPLIMLLKELNLITISKHTSNQSNLIAIYKTDDFKRFVAELNQELDVKSQEKLSKIITTEVDIEEVLEKLLIFMKNEVESLGLRLSQIGFDFSSEFINTFIGNNLSIYCEEGEDLLKFKNKTNYSEAIIKQAINIAKIRKLVKSTYIGRRTNERSNFQYNIFIELTDLGYNTAVNCNRDINVEESRDLLENDLTNKPLLWLTYNNEQKILLNDIFLIHSCQLNSMNDRLLKFLTKSENNNKTFNRQELFDLGILKNSISKTDDIRSQTKETKSFFSFLDDIQITGDLRRIFFPNASTNAISFQNNITQDILNSLNIRYIDIKALTNKKSTRNNKI